MRENARVRLFGRPLPKQFIGLESLESRLLPAAHIVGSPVSYSTIQAAVDAAAPGATIVVDPGVYPELVGINKPLTIDGAQADVDARSNTRQGDAADESIVTGEAVGSETSSGFYIAASDVTIDGFTVQGNTSVGEYGAGIVIAPNECGTHILNNIVQDNIAGLYLSNVSATDPAVIQYNVFQFNNNPGANGGRGIYSDGGVSGGNLTNVTIDSNFFLSNYGTTGTTGLEAAIGLESMTPGGQSNIRITNNVMEGNGKAVLAYNTDDLTISGNTITTIKDQWSGALRFEGNVSDVTIENNSLYDNTGPAVHIDSKTASQVSSGFTINDNNFYGNSSAYGSPGSALIVGADDYSGTLDATNNWWGSATGPSGDDSGSGDGIVADGNTVLCSPWLTAPAVAQETPFDGLAASVNAPIQAENFDQGGPGDAYLSGRSNNPGGQYRATGVGIATAQDIGGGYYVGYTAAGQWLNYTINVAQAGDYRIDIRLADDQAVGGTIHFDVDGVNVTGAVVIPNTGGWQAWETISTGTFSLTAGTHVLQLALDAGGSSTAVADFNWFQVTGAQAPAIPMSLSVTAASQTELDLAWTDSSNDVDHFDILRQTGDGPYVPIGEAPGTATGYADISLSPGVTYSYQVIAVDSAGNESLPQGPATAVTPTPPGAPTNLQVSAVTATGATITWQASAAATGWSITRTVGSGSPAVIATLSAAATSFTDTGLPAGASCTYTVTAFNSAGTGAGATVTLQTLPAAPTDPTATADEDQIDLTWVASDGATAYDVYRGTSSGGESATPIATNVIGTAYIDTDVTDGVTYFYQVTAIDSSGPSAAGTEVSAALPVPTQADPPPAPTNPDPAPTNSDPLPNQSPSNPSPLQAVLNGSPPASAVAGSKIKLNLSALVTDTATTPVNGTVTARWYLSTGSTIDSSSVSLGAPTANKLKLKPGGHASLDLKTAAIPASMPAGVYHILVQIADPTGATSVAASSATVTIAAPFVELTGAFTAVPTSVASGRAEPVTLTITNTGNIAVAETLPLLLGVTPDGSTADMTVLARTTKPIRLAPDHSMKLTLHVADWPTAAGNDQLVAESEGAVLTPIFSEQRIAIE